MSGAGRSRDPGASPTAAQPSGAPVLPVIMLRLAACLLGWLSQGLLLHFNDPIWLLKKKKKIH